MLISEVLRILDGRELPARETPATVADPFSAILESAGPNSPGPMSAPEISRGNMEAPGMLNPLPPKDRTAIFSVEQRSYDSFLRALKEAKKPLGVHALDLFQ